MLESRSSLLSRIAKNSVVGMVEKLFEIVTGVVSISILARYLNIESFGLYTIILTYIGLLITLGNVGLDRIMVRNIAANKEKLLEHLQDMKGASIVIAGFSLILIIIISYLLRLDNEMTIAAVSLFAISELLAMYGTIYMSVFKAFEKMEYNTFITFLAKTVGMVGLITVTYLNLGFFAIFAALAVGNVFKAFLTISIFKKYFSRKHIPVSFTNSGAIIKEVLIIAVSIFFAAASLRMGVFMLKAFGALKDVAYFQAANALFLQVQPIAVVFVTALYPVISNRKQSPILIFEKAAKYIFIMSLPVMAIMFFCGNELIVLIYGSNYMAAIPAMKILMLSVAFAFLANLFEIGLLAEHRQNMLTIGWGISFFVNLVLGVFLVPKYGIIGCAAVMSLSYMTLLFALYYFTSNYTMFKIKKNIFLKPGVAFLIMVFYLYFFTATGKPLSIKLDILNSLVSLSLYMAVLFMLKAFSIKEVELVKNLLAPKMFSK
mgnify:FL=1